MFFFPISGCINNIRRTLYLSHTHPLPISHTLFLYLSPAPSLSIYLLNTLFLFISSTLYLFHILFLSYTFSFSHTLTLTHALSHYIIHTHTLSIYHTRTHTFSHTLITEWLLKTVLNFSTKVVHFSKMRYIENTIHCHSCNSSNSNLNMEVFSCDLS